MGGMKTIFLKIISTFDNHSSGFSARKMTAFAFVCFLAYLHKFHATDGNAVEFAIIDVSGALIALGIITAEQLVKLINGK